MFNFTQYLRVCQLFFCFSLQLILVVSYMLIKFKRINDIREDNDLTVKEISKIIGISSDNFYDYANGRSNFPLEKLNLFVDYFKVSFDYVCSLSNVKTFYNRKIDLNVLKNRLYTVRKENRLSQNKVANTIGDSQSTYWNYEKGKSIIPLSKLYLLAKFYNVSIDYFVGKTDEKTIL